MALARDVHVNLLLLSSRSLDALEELCRDEGITHAQYVALWTLCLADDPDAGLPVGAVADGRLNRAPDATRLTDRPERAGPVERGRNPHRRRRGLVRTTDAGGGVAAPGPPREAADLAAAGAGPCPAARAIRSP